MSVLGNLYRMWSIYMRMCVHVICSVRVCMCVLNLVESSSASNAFEFFSIFFSRVTPVFRAVIYMYVCALFII